jgi:prolyl oligopeptidase
MKPRVIACLFFFAAFSVFAANAPTVIHGGHGITLPPPPTTQAKPVTDNVSGHEITDPYRWLEDGKSPQTRAWIGEQMKYTEDYLNQVKNRPGIVKRLTELERVETYTIPLERNGVYFFTKRLPEENQASIYMRKGLHGEDVRLIDATKLSADQNTSIGINDIAQDGSLLVYGIRQGGADEEVIKVLDVNKHQELPDTLPRARYNNMNLAPDKKGLYYGKFEHTGTNVYYHHFGTDPSQDQLVFGKKFGDETFGQMELIDPRVTESGRYLVITVGHGVPAKRVDIYTKDLRSPDSQIKQIVHGIDSRFTPVNYGDDLYVMTDYKAPNYSVLKIAIDDPAPDKWKTIVPEGKDAITNVSIVGGKLFVTGLHDVVTETRIFSLDGKQVGQISYPALGSASPVRGRAAGHEGFYRFESFTIPPTICHFDTSTDKADIFAKPTVPFNSDNFDVKQVFYNSKDGTRVPMFIAGKKGAKRDGTTPTLMYAYGGFNLSTTPQWDPEYAWWIEQGGYYAQPSLRGGGEYGEKWHEAGMFEKKQNVFDDFFAAAEYLIDNKYTSPEHFAIRGRSNGGLLMGAAMTQHPELFGAIWCGYPLLDMIRFQNFLVGRWWTAEYGSAENPQQFPYLIKYSPYQNVRRGAKYPAIMFNTGDSDTRVDPLHARKMTALMQAESGSTRPILLHYETNAGHSSGVSITQRVNDTADELAFLWNEVTGPAPQDTNSKTARK